ncbi:MAG: amino acid decarboxylase, partial [Anaerolineae bacterium]|nr:amino acid decarboxylase [Anaerolineae bacterium]
MNNKHNWNWSPEEIQRIGYQVVDIIAEYLATLPEKAVFTPFPKDSAEAFLSSTAAPQNGLDVETILEEFTAHIAPYPFGNGHPRFYGWVNSPPAVIGIFAEALAAMMNPSVAGGNHAPVYVEHQVLNWFRELLGLPPESKGLLVSGGSMANLTALAVARHVKAGLDVRAEGVQGLPAQLIVYTSEEGHS